MGTTGEEARPEHHVGLVFEQGHEQAPKVAGVVLQVGVVDGHEVACGMGDAGAQGRSLALVDGVPHHHHTRVRGGQLSGDLGGSIH